jgi:hypothetical protein
VVGRMTKMGYTDQHLQSAKVDNTRAFDTSSPSLGATDAVPRRRLATPVKDNSSPHFFSFRLFALST